MTTKTASQFTDNEVLATNLLASIPLEKRHVNAIVWGEHRRLNPTYTLIVVLDSQGTGNYFTYAGDALRIARLTDLKVHISTFGGINVETASFPPEQIGEIVAALNKSKVNVSFIC
jgi:hypothetical protein